jgi:NADPH-dependent curcumin reductase CurA
LRAGQTSADCTTYGYDVALDYKDEGFREALKSACAEGVDVYFDNVGGELSGRCIAI